MAKKKDNINRLKALPVSVGELSDSKLSLILEIRNKYIHFANQFVENAFKPCFFSYDSFEKPKQALENEIFQLQNNVPNGILNKAYIEKARKTVSTTLWNRIVSGKKDFLHKIHHIDKEKFHSKKDISILESKNQSPQKYQFFPNETKALKEDLDFIKSEYKSMNPKERIQNTFEIITKESTFSFNKKQIELIKILYFSVVERFEKPIFGEKDFFDITIDLDYRIVKNYKEKIELIGQDLNLFIDKTNKKYHFFLELSNPIPREKHIKIPLAINFHAWRRSFSKNETKGKSFSLVIKNNSIEVKHIIEKEQLDISIKAKYDELNNAKYIVGRDFGYKETISLSVIENDFHLSIKEFEKRLNLKKPETKSFYENNIHTPKVIETLQFSGKKFLNKIKIISKRVDEISSHIKRKYNEIEELLVDLRNQLGIDEDTLISKKMKTKNQKLSAKIDLLFKMIEQVKTSKSKRKAMYNKVSGIKRTWFGFLSTQELKLIKKYDAALVVEDLTVMAAEKAKPSYKGKRFNKMINNGSKGQYMRIAQEKMFWNGILEHRIPSFYSSTSCVKHAVVDKKMRKGEIFKCQQCNKVEDADLHAATTISSFLMLKPTASTM